MPTNDPTQEGQLPKYVTVGPEKWLLLNTYKMGPFGRSFEMYYDFQVRSDDVFITGLPRSGTNMISELAYLLVNNLDYEKAAEDLYRSWLLESDMLLEFELNAMRAKGICIKVASGVQILDGMEGRRTILSHLPFRLLPSDVMKTKVVYIARNPMDLAVSLFNLQKNIGLIAGIHKFEDFWFCFKNGLALYGPYWAHIKQAVEVKDRPNVHFVFYENFVTDLEKGIKGLSIFLEKELTETELESLVEFAKFKNSKRRNLERASQYSEVKKEAYFKYGRPGVSKEYFSAEMGHEAEEWVKKNVEGIGIENFPLP